MKFDKALYKEIFGLRKETSIDFITQAQNISSNLLACDFYVIIKIDEKNKIWGKNYLAALQRRCF